MITDADLYGAITQITHPLVAACIAAVGWSITHGQDLSIQWMCCGAKITPESERARGARRAAGPRAPAAACRAPRPGPRVPARAAVAPARSNAIASGRRYRW